MYRFKNHKKNYLKICKSPKTLILRNLNRKNSFRSDLTQPEPTRLVAKIKFSTFITQVEILIAKTSKNRNKRTKK